ncbi:hypothetical protein [Nocardioides panaciterrulae]|uniref:Uncharacterized protein n=1 Tax=Nocardioides panaciterrulae TaxID=661492 RepID=A0A7Y9E843_9ACTN|nr:hypothetical protein [Nocardioides panaciterrulae]NYD42737.1 hypothetical protein [Nocardioides panaciterrulae]
MRLLAHRDTQESTTAGVYGVIVGAAVMAAAHAESVAALDAAVLGTLLVYWTAERYARLVARRIHAGHRPGREEVRRELATGWEIVTATLLPLAVLSVAGRVGADLDTAVLLGLGCSTLLLALAGWEMGRHGALSRRERGLSTAVATALGLAMIVLKSLLH